LLTRRLVIAAALLTLAASAAAAQGPVGSAQHGVISLHELPGAHWALVIRDDQLGRVGKALSAAHASCPSASTPSSRPTDLGLGLFSRIGTGLSTSLSLVLTFPSDRSATAVFRAALSPRIAGCIARSLTGPGKGGTVESWVVDSPLASAVPGSRAARLAVHYEAPGEAWTAYLDLVDIHAGTAWGLYLFFASESAQADRYERALLVAATARLGARRATQGRASVAAACLDSPGAQYAYARLQEAIAAGDTAGELRWTTLLQSICRGEF
jgi:hypothetical protein